MRFGPSFLIASTVGCSALMFCPGCSSDSAPDVTVAPLPEGGPEPIGLQFVDRADRLSDRAEVDGRVGVVVDLDADGQPDIVQPTSAGEVRVFWNQDGEFELAPTTIPALQDGYANQIVAADFDGDEAPDLLLLNTEGAKLQLFLNKGKRAFKASTSVPYGSAISPRWAVAADLDGDGDNDVIATLAPSTPEGGTTVPARALLLVNDGKGSFSDETAKRIVAPGLEPYGVAAGDLDGDGSPDLFFSGDGTSHRLLVSDGAGVFRDAAPDAIPPFDKPHGRIPVLADLDGDGAPDVFVPSTSANVVLLNDGHGRLTDETPFVLGAQPGKGYSALALDLDQDTATDLVVANPGGPLLLARNDGTGRLFDYTGGIRPVLPSASDSMSVGAGDFDGDGDLDLFVSRASWSVPWLLVNRQSDNMDDSDEDGIADDVDNCPGEPNPDQANGDAHHFNCAGGTACKEATGCTLALYEGEGAFLVCETPRTWADARAFCQTRGSDLAVVDSAAKNAWLASLSPEAAWLGLSDSAIEGTFAWVNGSAVGTSYWNDGEPNDSGGVEDCVGMFTSGDTAGKWNDFDCSATHAFFCEDTSVRAPADPGDACDVCPTVYDPTQKDTDKDGIGDACQASD